MIYERHLNRIICDEYNDEDLKYIQCYLKYKNYLRYINIEIYSNENSEKCRTEDKRKVYDNLKDWLGNNNFYNIIYDIIKEDKLEGVGLIFSSVLSDELGLNEQQYIEKLKIYSQTHNTKEDSIKLSSFYQLQIVSCPWRRSQTCFMRSRNSGRFAGEVTSSDGSG